MTRRELWARLAQFGAASGLSALAGVALYERPRRTRPGPQDLPDFSADRGAVHAQMSVSRGGTPITNTRAAIEALGGMGTFIQAGDRVMIKPNLAWKRIPAQAATTDPELLAELCRLCLDAGAREVVVFDSPCDPGSATFKSSGAYEAVSAVGAKAIYPEKTDYLKLTFGGELIKTWAVWKELPKFDKVINAAIVKHHVQSRTTAGMKNWYGILGGDRGLLHQDMDGSIVDLGAAVKPTLTVLDATRLLMRNGPTGGSLGDVKQNHAVAAGVDPVALDAWAVQELGQRVEDVAYIEKAVRRGVGTSAWKSLRLKEVTAG